MKDQGKRLPLAEQIRKGLEEAIRHAKGEITLKTTTLEMPDRPPDIGADEIIKFRHKNGMSQAVFAQVLTYIFETSREGRNGQALCSPWNRRPPRVHPISSPITVHKGLARNSFASLDIRASRPSESALRRHARGYIEAAMLVNAETIGNKQALVS